MSESIRGQYSSLQWSEEEVDEAIARRINLDAHPDVRADLERLPKDKAAYVLNRHSVIDKIVWNKFCKKMEERDLFELWAGRTDPPNMTTGDKSGEPVRYETETAWFEKYAPDLIPELKAHRQWHRERDIEWAKIWELQQSKTEAKAHSKSDDTKRSA